MEGPLLPVGSTNFTDKEKLIIFRVEGKVITKYLLMLTIFLFALSLLTLTEQTTTVLLVLAVLGYYIGRLFFSKRPVEIVINLESMLLTINSSRLIFIKSTASYPLELITYSYKLEVLARGNTAKVFRLYIKDKCIADILPEYSGWSESIIERLHQLLSETIPDNVVKQKG